MPVDDERRCTATSRKGKRCSQRAIPGGTVCHYHGGAAPQVRRAAQARAARMQAHDAAQRMVTLAGVDADPIEHLLDSLHRATALMIVWGEMVAALDADAQARSDTTGELRGELRYDVAPTDSFDELTVTTTERLLAFNYRGEAQVHPFVTEYEQALERRAKLAKLCLDAGVAERQVKLAEQQGQMLAQVIRGVLTDLGVADHPQAPAAVRKHLMLVAGESA